MLLVEETALITPSQKQTEGLGEQNRSRREARPVVDIACRMTRGHSGVGIGPGMGMRHDLPMASLI